jgi:hypothetical protein
MLDRLVQLYLLHTPEVVRELQAGAVASANRRYAKYREAVMDLLLKDSREETVTGGHRDEDSSQ